jgi:ABC-2 type transport system ATP-binding protein
MIPAVRTRGLTKTYGEAVAVRGIDLEVPAGQVYGFLGPNGAGKTTTLRMLLNLIRPTAGTVEIFGASTGTLDRVGALIEGPAFYPHLSGRDNLRALAVRARLPRGRIAEALELAGLAGRADHRYATYSLGMKQRLGVAAANLTRPDLLVLDEPTNGLDPAGMADMRATVRAFANAGRTVLLSSHLLDEVRQVCDHVGIISHGTLVVQKPITELAGRGTLRVVAEPLDHAYDKVQRMLGPDAVRIGDGALAVTVDAEMAPAVNRGLVAEGIAVRELRWREPDLEEIFLALTEGPRHGQ